MLEKAVHLFTIPGDIKLTVTPIVKLLLNSNELDALAKAYGAKNRPLPLACLSSFPKDADNTCRHRI